MCLSGHLMRESTRQHHQGKQMRYEDAIFPPCIPARKTAGTFDMLKMCLCWLLIGIVRTNVRSKQDFVSSPFLLCFCSLPSGSCTAGCTCAAGRALTSPLEHHTYTQTTINSPAKPDNGMHSPFFLLQPSKGQILPPFTVQKIPSIQGCCAAFTLMQLKPNFSPKLFVYSNIKLMWDIFWARFLQCVSTYWKWDHPSSLPISQGDVQAMGREFSFCQFWLWWQLDEIDLHLPPLLFGAEYFI